MRNENHGAFKILQRLHQHLFRRQIKVVGGLVKTTRSEVFTPALAYPAVAFVFKLARYVLGI